MKFESRIQKIESNIRVINSDVIRLINSGSLFQDLSETELYEYFFYYFQNESMATYGADSILKAQNLLKTTSNDEIVNLIGNSLRKPLTRRNNQNIERRKQGFCIYTEVNELFEKHQESFIRGESNNKFEFLRKYSESEREILLSMFLILGFD